MTRSASWDKAPPNPGLAGETLENATEFSFKGVQGDVEYGAFRDDDDVEPRGDLISSEHISNPSFGPIAFNRAAELSRGRNPEPCDG